MLVSSRKLTELWQLPQLILANILLKDQNIKIEGVYVFEETVTYETNASFIGYALGNKIFLGRKACFGGNVFTHEFGHTLQSKTFGPAYIFLIALPSLATAVFANEQVHYLSLPEKHATEIGAAYLVKKYPDYEPIGGWQRYDWIFRRKFSTAHHTL